MSDARPKRIRTFRNFAHGPIWLPAEQTPLSGTLYIRADAVQPPAELVERLQIAIAAAAGRENTGTEYETVKVCTSLLRDLLAWMDGKP